MVPPGGRRASPGYFYAARLARPPTSFTTRMDGGILAAKRSRREQAQFEREGLHRKRQVRVKAKTIGLSRTRFARLPRSCPARPDRAQHHAVLSSDSSAHLRL